MSSSPLLSVLRHPLVPFVAAGLALAFAGLGALSTKPEPVEQATAPAPATQAYAAAELVAPPAPGSFAVAPQTVTPTDPVDQVATFDCVAKLRQDLALIRLGFDKGNTTVTADHLPLLTQLSARIIDCENAYVMVAGHADGLGSDEGNMARSWARADHTLNQLVAFGVDPSVVEAVGYGATTPLSQGSDEEDPADRRVEFHVFRVRSTLP